jgi:hypothetical protein
MAVIVTKRLVSLMTITMQLGLENNFCSYSLVYMIVES